MANPEKEKNQMSEEEEAYWIQYYEDNYDQLNNTNFDSADDPNRY